MTKDTFILILGIVLFVDIALLFYFIKKRHDIAINPDDNDFIKHEWIEGVNEIQKNTISGTKKLWNIFEFVLNKKGYKGALDSKMGKANSKFKNAMALEAQREWSSDLNENSFVKVEQLENFVKILKHELENLGVQF
jgi:hypothetical protein